MLTTSDHRPPLPLRTVRLGPLVLGLVLAVAAVLALARPAAAVDEFPSDPHATITFDCGTSGANAMVTMTNPHGLSPAHFTLSYADHDDQQFSIDPGAVDYGGFGSFTENESHTVTATATTGYTVSATLEKADCYQTVGTIELVCEGEQPVLHAEATMLGVGTVVDFEHDGVVESEGFTGSHAFTTPVTEDQPFSASMSTSKDGVFATLEGTPDCVPAVIPVTVPTVPETVPPTVPVPVDEPEVPVVDTTEVATVPLAAAPAPVPGEAPTELPRTGDHSAALAAIGATLLGLGILVRRWSLRLWGR